MNILYTVNDKFVPQAAAGICSVCVNNREAEKIHFYVFSLGITSQNKIELRQLAKTYKRDITIIEIKDIQEYLDFEFDTLGWNRVILARLFMSKILPESVERIIYMDGDTIVRGSLKELWELDLQGKTLGMSIEPTANRGRKKELGLETRYYYNSGVLLVDLKRWRQIRAEELMVDFYKKKNGNLFAADQDIINGALKDEICPILPKYNFCNIYYQYPYWFLRKLLKPLEYFLESQFVESLNNPIIIHFLGEERPWRRGNTHRYQNEYKKYLGMTKWKDSPMEEGWRLYFFCWKMFNIFTKPFPQLRYSIIDCLIPYFMNYRARKLKKGNS